MKWSTYAKNNGMKYTIFNVMTMVISMSFCSLFFPLFSSLLHSIHNQTRALWHYPQARYKRDIFFFQFCKENSSTPLHSAIPLASFR